MLSIQVKSNSLSKREKRECAKKLFMDKNYIKCSFNQVCTGCDYCESKENFDFLIQNQVALVFSFGSKDPKRKPVEKKVLSGPSPNSKLTVIFNNGPEYLKGLWGLRFPEVMKIINEILAFSWLPHNFIDKASGTGPYHRNQLFESYLDKPLFPEFSDLFREELGWPELVNPKEEKEKYQLLIDSMDVIKRK